MSNAQCQARWRAARQDELTAMREKVRTLENAAKAPLRNGPHDARAIELEAENKELRAELTMRPSMDDMRRRDAIANHTQRITTDIETYNLIRRCLHPDSRISVSDEILHKAWRAFSNLEPLTYDKSKIPPPLPNTLDELIRRRNDAVAGKAAARKAASAKQDCAP